MASAVSSGRGGGGAGNADGYVQAKECGVDTDGKTAESKEAPSPRNMGEHKVDSADLMEFMGSLSAFLRHSRFEDQLMAFLEASPDFGITDPDPEATEHSPAVYARYTEFMDLVNGILESFCEAQGLTHAELFAKLSSFQDASDTGATVVERLLQWTEYPTFFKLVVEFQNEDGDDEGTTTDDDSSSTDSG